MKNQIKSLLLSLALLVASLGQTAFGAVSFTLTPSAISNTYSGIITLQVSGLNNGDSVVVQKFLDSNTNGVVDGGDLLMQQFQLTDGQASVFTNGGSYVTNFNVPGDTDGSANGAITALLYPGLDFAQRITGKYLFVFSSPVGHFAPQTNSFSVTNFPYAQSFAGNVVNNGTNVPNAVVLLFQPQGQNSQHPVAGTVANNAGAYAINALPGTYLLGAFKSNFVANLSASPYATLGAGATLTTNVPLTNATMSISGNLIDLNNSSVGLAGVLLAVQTASNLTAIAFTDTNGNFTARVTPDYWKIGNDSSELGFKGYLSLQNRIKVNTTTGSVAGVTMALPRANAIFYGTVKDNAGNPLSGIDIYSSDNNNNYQADGYSFTNGNYIVLAQGGVSNDSWQENVSNDSNPTNYLFPQGPYGVTLGGAQAYPWNFTAVLAANHITGNVQYNGANVHGVQVYAYATIGTNSYQAQMDTDVNGNYFLNVANGTWNVNVYDCGCSDSDSLNNVLNGANYQDPNSQSVTINNNNGTANFVVPPGNSGQIFGYLTSPYGDGIAGVTVSASDGLGDNYSTTTDINGYYSLFAVAGTYTVSVDCGQLNALNFNCVSDSTGNMVTTGGSVEVDFMPSFLNVPNYPFTVLHGFSAATATNAIGLYTNSDGATPAGGLLLSGNLLYGTTVFGGTNGTGTVFALNTNLASLTGLHTFSIAAPNGLGLYTNSDGGLPQSVLVLSGNTLYGTAGQGGVNGYGTVFALNTNGTGFRLIHTFTALDAATQTTNSDGVNPYAAVILSGNMLYGTTDNGGAHGNGTVFAVNTNGSFTVLHTFSATMTNSFFVYTNGDGANPNSRLVLAGGMLYGTAGNGGSAGAGTVFAVSTNGTGFTNLYTFTGGNDGAAPMGLLLSSNLLYGAAGNGQWGYGTLFAVSTNGTGLTVLHQFTGGADGAGPNPGLVVTNNTLYGTTVDGGGSAYAGTVFAVNVNGTNFTVLHTFSGGSDGGNPLDDSLVLSGNTLYGTAQNGGVGNDGTVFAISIASLPPAPVISSPARFPNGLFQMLVNATAGQNYTVQMSTNLASTNWISLLVTNPPGGTFLFSDPNATNKLRCYRVLVGP